jgi:capsular exopolysaccharide synthesis family protein
MSVKPAGYEAYTPYSSGANGHLSDYLRILYKRRWTAGLAFLVVVLSGTYSSLRKTPIYEATTQVLIEKEAKRPSSINSVLEDRSGYYDEDFYQTQYRILQSRALAWRALVAMDPSRANTERHTLSAATTAGVQGRPHGIVGWARRLVGAPERIEPPPADETTDQAAAISGFLGGLNILPIRNTHMVEVRYRSADPVVAARSANALAAQYKQQMLQARFMASKETSDWLSQSLEEQRKKVEASQTALAQYRERNNAIALDDRQNTVVQTLSDLNAQLARATGERIDKEATYQRLVTLQQAQNREALESFPAIMGSEVIQGLRADLRTQQTEQAKITQLLGEKMPQVQAINAQVRVTQGKLDGEIDKVVQSVKSDYLTAQAKEKSLSEALNQQKNETATLGRKGVEYAALEREALSNQTLYDNLLQTAKETSVTGEYKGSSIEIIDAAEVPRTPVLPNTRRDLFMSLLLGCGVAFGLTFGFEYLDSRIKTPDELKAHLGLAFLGLVPVVPDKPKDGEVLLLSPDTPPGFGEAIRAVRTAVIFSSAEEGAKTIVITSTAPGEGKTLVSTNLSAALAQAGQRTLIIDGDMRRPRVHDVFSRPQEPGLSNVLVATGRMRDAIRPTNIPGLSVLPAGHIPPNPAELLGSTRYLELIEELRHDFDWIVIDAPPVMAVTDAAVLANSATGVVFVVGADMTSRRNAMSAIEHLQAVRARFIGGVLNRVNLQRHGYYYSPYYRKDYTQVYERASR